mgnify:CR=1 FL=1
MLEEEFKIKSASFEGPLDLLLSLIEKRKVFISDISLAQVADDYIAHVQAMSSYPVANTAHFILIASTLLLIKSKSLLPGIALTEEESGSIEDLEDRLKLYKRFKELSVHVTERFGKHIIFSKLGQKNIPAVFSPDESISSDEVLASAKRVIQSLPKHEELPKAVIQKMISLEEMIERLTDRMQNSLKMNFGEFAKTQGSASHDGAKYVTSRADRISIIVSFLAMLELVKQGVLDASQEHHSHDISIETKTFSVPHYN